MSLLLSSLYWTKTFLSFYSLPLALGLYFSILRHLTEVVTQFFSSVSLSKLESFFQLVWIKSDRCVRSKRPPPNKLNASDRICYSGLNIFALKFLWLPVHVRWKGGKNEWLCREKETFLTGLNRRKRDNEKFYVSSVFVFRRLSKFSISNVRDCHERLKNSG